MRLVRCSQEAASATNKLMLEDGCGPQRSDQQGSNHLPLLHGIASQLEPKERMEHIGGEVRRQASGQSVVGVVLVAAWSAAENRNAAAGMLGLSIGRQVEVEELALECDAHQKCPKHGRTDGEELERPGLRQEELGWEDEVVGVFLRSFWRMVALR